jgi:spectinomycin phosphotransferase
VETRPDIDLCAIGDLLGAAYGVRVEDIAFLPLGADPDAAAWRVVIADGPALFLKTRHVAFAAGVLAVPRFLRDAGIAAVVAPLRTRDGALSVASGDLTLILYTFIEGTNGFDRALSVEQWVDFGASLRRVHDAILPPAIASGVQTEAFGSQWRDRVEAILAKPPTAGERDAVARDLDALLDRERDAVERIVTRAAELADILRRRQNPLVLCHTDIHAGNVLIGPDGAVQIVDWDAPRLAPRERDLMFIGGGVAGTWNQPEEVDAFYRGYGAIGIDPMPLAYYRYERIVEDIAVGCEQILRGETRHRAEAFAQLSAQWQPRDVIEIADATYDRLVRGEWRRAGPA